MVEHPLYGMSLPERGWVPSPGYVLRRYRVLQWVASLPPGERALEIGCGPGALLHDLAGLGYRCEAVETSERALALAAEVFAGRPEVQVHASPQPDWEARFDLLLAFEVLEHIEYDDQALGEWVEWLAPGGHLLISVPAHERRWNPTDAWAGHYRRYESARIRSLVSEAGLELVSIECYGFPLANLLEAVRARTFQRGAVDDRTQATAASGVERSVERRMWPLQTSLAGELSMQVLCRLQDAFLDTELGNGFIAVARKPSSG